MYLLGEIEIYNKLNQYKQCYVRIHNVPEVGKCITMVLEELDSKYKILHTFKHGNVAYFMLEDREQGL